MRRDTPGSRPCVAPPICKDWSVPNCQGCHPYPGSPDAGPPRMSPSERAWVTTYPLDGAMPSGVGPLSMGLAHDQRRKTNQFSIASASAPSCSQEAMASDGVHTMGSNAVLKLVLVTIGTPVS